MPKNNFYSDFNHDSVRNWEKTAQQELGNKNPWEYLTRAKHGATIKPYYDSADVVAERKLHLPVTTPCQNVPKVIVTDEKQANEEALTHLNAGADAVWFDIQQNVKVEKLLAKIELSFCSVFFNAKEVSLFNELADYIESISMQEKVTGAFYWSAEKTNSRYRHWKNFHPYGILVQENENIVDEIVDSLLMAVDSVERLTMEGFSLEEALRSLAFLISVDTDFFLSISKIRALGNLWFTLQEGYQIKNLAPVFIHGHSKPWIKEGFQPHGNLLKQTTAAMAASIGGCQALTIEPEMAENKMMSRIARNVALMLGEESNLSKVSDPTAGSFYVDALTHQIAGDAWNKFQQR